MSDVARSSAASLFDLDAAIFDTDGVVTDTARAHAAAWKELFDAYLAGRSQRTGDPFVPFDPDADYRAYVDGKPRYDGVRSFLASRGIELPDGDPSDPPERETVCGLGNRKNEAFLAALREHGVRAYPSTLLLIRALRARGIKTAIISASRNMHEVLDAARVHGLFDADVDGVVADELRLPGKPDPGIFLEASARLSVQPGRAAVIEDALAGVEAGRQGGFGLVIGVDRSGHPEALREAGADVVVRDLGELLPHGADRARSIRDLPRALDALGTISRRLEDMEPAVFLDYDGTLTPIVDDPARATLPEQTRLVLARLAERAPVAVLSGRDLADVQAMVQLPGIWYAGSHGFDIAGPGGERYERAGEYLPALDAAELALEGRVAQIAGARIERKRYAVAVHFRKVPPDRIPEVEGAVRVVAAGRPELRVTGGKKIFELRPALDWDKGTALLWLLDLVARGQAVVPIYVGDDETDEDAFRAVAGRGLGMVVHGEDDDRDTVAEFAFADPDEVRVFLEAVSTLAGERR